VSDPRAFTVRPATAADVDALVGLREAVAAEGRWIGLELPVDRPAEAAKLTATIAAGTDLLLVAEADGRVVGYTGLTLSGAGHAHLFMALLDGWRGRGIGSALLAAALDWARAHPDVAKVLLQLWPDNAAALALYRKHGFIVEGYRHRHWPRRSGERWDIVDMGLLVDD